MSIWPQRPSGWHSSICRNQKWQCKSSLCNLNSIHLGIHELDVVFNYIITIYTATEFALQIAEVLSSRTFHLHISYIMKSRRTSKRIWAWQLTQTSPQPLHNARHSHAQINRYTLLAIFSRWILCELWGKSHEKYTESAKCEFQKIKTQ